MTGYNTTQNQKIMSRAIISALALWLAFSGVAAAEQLYVNESGWWREGGALNASGTPIQAAVDNTTVGDSIFVWNGSYSENVDVDKRLTMEGEGADVVTVTAASSSSTVFEVTANYVNISGFAVRGATATYAAGICLSNADYCDISWNNVYGNYRGIYLSSSNNNTLQSNTANSNFCARNGYGIRLYSSSNNTLIYNTANSNYYGIYLSSSNNNTLQSNAANSNFCAGNGYGIRLHSSSNNTLIYNTANSNGDDGIYLSSSNNNTLQSNTAYSNSGIGGIHMSWSSGNILEHNTANSNTRGIRLQSSSNNTLRSNAANSNDYGIYLDSSSDNTLQSNTVDSNGYDGIYLRDSSNNMLRSNIASNNGDGIHLRYSSSNTLQSNTANSNDGYDTWLLGCGDYIEDSNNNMLHNNTIDSNDDHGIYIEGSGNNILTNNNASNNNDYGVSLSYSSSYNKIYNNYFDNTNNAYDDGYNIWNTTKTAGTNIIGGPYLGGNYWSDYAGVDTDGDGLGDTLTPYNSSGNIATGGDWRPLVQVTISPVPTINITSFAPPSPVADNEGAARTFSITVNQTANVSWLINGTEAQTNESVTSASYTNTSAAPGVWNVSAIASNTNGTAMQMWWWVVLANTPSPPLNITSWSNNKTNDNSMSITLNESESVCFNATANQTVTTWNWFNNGVAQSNTCDNYTTSWIVNGTYTVSVNATNTNGTSDTKTWTVAVKAPSPCYIATAAYGTPLDKNIDTLRDFRDESLLTNPIGEAFVSTYYRTSPPIADALRANDGLRTVTRLTLITPLVYLSKSLLNGILVMGIFILGLTAVFSLRKERMKILRPLLVGTSSVLVFIAAIFSLGFIGYAIPLCATVGAYMLPFVIPLSVVFTMCTVLKMRANRSDNIKKHVWNSKV